jgi:hypothetical protein
MLENVQEILDQFKFDVIRDARKNLKSGLNRKYPIDASGKLSKSIQANVKESQNSIELTFEMEGYGVFQDVGVKGIKKGRSLRDYSYKKKGGKKGLKGMPPPSAFDKWSVRKRLAPRDKKGRFMSRKSLTFLIARKVFFEGIQPSLFFTRPFEKYFKRLPDEMIEKYGLDMMDLFDQITEKSLQNLNQ